MKRRLFKLINAAKKVTGKKHHLDFLTAILTIPVLLSVIIINYSNLQNMQNNKNIPTPTPIEKIIVVPQTQTNTEKSTTPTSATCIKNIGPVTISTPKEGEFVTENPVCININYTDSSYCSVVWSYRINNGTWSDFSSNNPCIYNLPGGNVKFELKIQSTVAQKEIDLTRNFTYKGGNNPIPSATSSATSN
jgi:hypothetical protein